MSTGRMNWKARRYLLTGRTDTPHGWSVYGLQKPDHPNARTTVHFFITDPERRDWIRQNPRARMAVGKRHPAVKEFRTQEVR